MNPLILFFPLLLALAADAAGADPVRSSLSPAMQAYLSGDVESALAQAEAVARRYPDSDFARGVLRSLREPLAATPPAAVVRYGSDVADAWQTARARWREGRRPPEGSVPSAFLSLPPSVRSALAVDAASGVSYLLTRDADRWRVADLFYTSFGRLGIGKSRRGDERTPVGIYWVTGRLQPPALAARYGARAFPLDYPNALDRASGRTGDGIWIHGGPTGAPVRPPRHTDGCIAIPDERFADLEPFLHALATPVIIAPAIEWTTATPPPGRVAAIRDALEAWLDARRRGDAARYFGMYAAGYSGRLTDERAWRLSREAELGAAELTGLAATEVEIYADPVVPDTYLTRFRQKLSTADGALLQTTKRLYWRYDGDRYLIVAEGGG